MSGCLSRYAVRFDGRSLNAISMRQFDNSSYRDSLTGVACFFIIYSFISTNFRSQKSHTLLNTVVASHVLNVLGSPSTVLMHDKKNNEKHIGVILSR